MTSLARSTSVSQPSSSATAMSPVCNQPSPEHPRGRVGIVPVAGEHVRAPHEDLAGIAFEHVAPVGVDQPHVDAGQRRSDRPGRGSATTAVVVTTGDASVSP